MSVYRRGHTWCYKFTFDGSTIRASSKSRSKRVCIDAERARQGQLERGYNGIASNERPQLFQVTADGWIKTKSAHWSPRTVTIEQLNLKHLKPIFGGMPLCDITSDALAGYQLAQLKEEASPKTINLEIGTLRGILRKHRLWRNLQPDVRMLRPVMTLA